MDKPIFSQGVETVFASVPAMNDLDS